MDFLTHSLLPLPEVCDFQHRLSAPNLPWRDGRLTAGDQAALVKNNSQLDPTAQLTLSIQPTHTKRTPLKTGVTQ